MKKLFVLLLLTVLLTACSGQEVIYVDKLVEVPGETVIVEKEVIVEVEVEKIVEVPVEGYIEKEVIKEVEVVKEVPVEVVKEVIVEKEIIIREEVEVPIDGDTFEKKFDVCYIHDYQGQEKYEILNVELKKNFLTSSYTLTLDKPNADGLMKWSFKNDEKLTVCHSSFGGDK